MSSLRKITYYAIIMGRIRKQEVNCMRYDYSKPYELQVLTKLHKVQLSILEDFDYVCEKYGLQYFALYGTAIGAARHQGFIPWDDDVDLGMLRADYIKFLSVFDKEMGDKYQIMTPLKDKKYTCTVTHLQKKGTKFIPCVFKNTKCNLGITIDIFPLDSVAPTAKLQKRQLRKTTFLGRLLFLCGTPYPLIPLKGLKGILASAVCYITHYILKIFGSPSRFIYNQFLKESQRYNDGDSDYVTSFEYNGSIRDMVEVKSLFPLKKVPFENSKVYLPANNDDFLKKVYGDYMEIPPEEEQINHCPYMIQFEGEQPLYF